MDERDVSLTICITQEQKFILDLIPGKDVEDEVHLFVVYRLCVINKMDLSV